MDRFTRLSVTESLSEDNLFSERAKKASGRSFAGTHAAGGILQKGDPLPGGDGVGKRISSGRRKSGATAAMANGRVPLGYEDVLGGPPLLTESLFAAQTQNLDDTDNILPSPAQVYHEFSQMQNMNNRTNNFASQTQNFDETDDIFPSRAQIYHEFSQMQNVNDRANNFASQMQTSNDRTEQIRGISGCPRTSSLPVFGASIYDDDVFGGAYHDVSHRASVGDSMRGLTKAMERKAAAKLCTSSLHTIQLNSARCFADDSASDESVITSGSSESRSEGDEVPSQQPGFSNTAVQKDKDKPLGVSRSYSVVCSSSDLNPFNFTYCSPRNSNRKSSNFISSEAPPDFVDIAPSNPPASSIRSMRKVSDLTKGSENENQARSSGYKELAREGYFARRMHARNNAVEQPKSFNGTEVDATANNFVVLESMLPFQSNQSSAESFSHKNVRNIKSTKVEESRNADELWITRDDVKFITSPSSLTCSLGSPLLCTLKQMSVPRKSKNGKDEQVIHNVDTNLGSFQCGTSELWTEGKKNVASVLENQADARSGDVAASMSVMREAMERAALKLKLAKETREKDECGNGLERMKCRDEREKIYEGGEKQRLGNETWKAHLIEEMEKEDNKKANRDQAYEKKEWELNGDLKEHIVVSERAYSHAWGLKKGTESFPAEAYETVTGLEKTRADTRDWAVERERNAVKRVMAEARTRVEHAALDPATKEACEQVALRAEVERVATEARERAERIATTVRKQQRNKNDSRYFFEKESQVGSLQRQTPTTMDASKTCESDRTSSNEGHQSSAAATNANRNAFSIDDPSKIQGEPSEHHGTCKRSQERVAKALQEKNQRDLQSQMEQLERHRASEMLDTSIKHWVAGKQGNLRKLLSDLHSILWPECGWQPVSLMDLITVEAVKKAYRKATLCVHPDKLQQKGATIQQKYKAEKVFNLLKDAWNRFQYQEVSLQQIPI